MHHNVKLVLIALAIMVLAIASPALAQEEVYDTFEAACAAKPGAVVMNPATGEVETCPAQVAQVATPVPTQAASQIVGNADVERLLNLDQIYRSQGFNAWATEAGFQFEAIVREARQPQEITLREVGDEAMVIIEGQQVSAVNLVATWPACYTVGLDPNLARLQNDVQPFSGFATLYADCRPFEEALLPTTDVWGLDVSWDQIMAERAQRLVEMTQLWETQGPASWMLQSGLTFDDIVVDASRPEFENVIVNNEMTQVITGVQVDVQNLTANWPTCFSTDQSVTIGNGRSHRPDERTEIANPSVLYTNNLPYSGTATVYSDCRNWGMLWEDQYNPYTREFVQNAQCVPMDFIRGLGEVLQVDTTSSAEGNVGVQIRFAANWTAPSGYALDYRSHFVTSVVAGQTATVWVPQQCVDTAVQGNAAPMLVPSVAGGVSLSGNSPSITVVNGNQPVTQPTSQQPIASNGNCLLTVSVPSAYLRGGPGMNYSVLGSISSGQTIQPVGQNAGWFFIGDDRWISGSIVAASGCESLPLVETPPAPAAPAVVPQQSADQPADAPATSCLPFSQLAGLGTVNQELFHPEGVLAGAHITFSSAWTAPSGWVIQKDGATVPSVNPGDTASVWSPEGCRPLAR